MKIKYIKLKNFRGYKDETKIDFDDLTVFVGKNDSGKSTILEALDIFINDGKGTIKIDKDDVNVISREEGDLETLITIVFTDLPKKIIIDSSVETTLRDEYLLNKDGDLEIIKKYNNANGPKIWINAYHPTNKECSDLLLKTNSNLRKIIKDNEIECENLAINSIMRKSIWSYFKEDLYLDTIEIDASKSDAKEIWSKISTYMPVYSLFQSDRSNTDSDSEVQDPLREAVKIILNDDSIQESLNDISKKVEKKLHEVSDRTLEKLKEMDPKIASELSPVIPSSDKLKWNEVFKSVSISGDGNIPINKRGSGVKRLILMSFFRGEAERLAEEGGSNGIIYAIEEPETSQHTNSQKKLIEAFKNMSKISGVQIILTTHSAFMVKQLEFENLKIINDNKSIEGKILKVDENYLNYPSLNEVNFLAFNEIIIEYHNELYGLIQAKAIDEDNNNYYEDSFDKWLKDKGIEQDRPYKRLTKDGSIKNELKTLPTLIRNIIHHPENNNNSYNNEELKESINQLRKICKILSSN